jgi:DNA-binding HxlR family transcriptional regulator
MRDAMAVAADVFSAECGTRAVLDGLLERTVYPVVPPHVEYALTPLGATLIEPLHALCDWAARHLEDVEAARSMVTSR